MEGFPFDVTKKVTNAFDDIKHEAESVKDFVTGDKSKSERENNDVLNSESGNTPEEEAESKAEEEAESKAEEEAESKDTSDVVAESAEPIEPAPEELSSTVEASVEKSNDSDVTALEQEEIEEKIIPSSNETDEVAPIAADEVLNETDKIMSPSTTQDEINGGSSEDKIKLPSFDTFSAIARNVVSEVQEVKERVLPSVDENGGVPPVTEVEPKGVEEAKIVPLDDSTGDSSGVVDREFVNDSLIPSVNATEIGSNDGVPETTENPSVTPQNQRSLQAASWRNCFGWFDTLWRSNRRLKI
ncbi:hypothetical protein MANES_01G127200v8 [Manihot esculenta]|uniref:Uncharacterized protein n=1 Tax=Manihot esculenta TaxID=3983 RepID=A0ACB7ICX3_MANES|nr:hypothetical protein MANES_01G127200v8 [Manihot esculenta]